jgi:Na+/H+-dicarboxylate symporter
MSSGRVTSSCGWGALTLVLWGLTLAVVFVMPLTFPAIQNASFFSTTLVEERAPLDFVALYIPSNPFQSLANSIVPAVVLFSVFLGAALMGIEKKEPLLGSLQVLERMLARANRFAVRLTPFGLFAIAAVTVGTADTEQMATCASSSSGTRRCPCSSRSGSCPGSWPV